MMAYTTYTAAVQFREARKLEFRRPARSRLIEVPIQGLGWSGGRGSPLHRLVTETAATR